jgi:hypothetical protein
VNISKKVQNFNLLSREGSSFFERTKILNKAPNKTGRLDSKSYKMTGTPNQPIKFTKIKYVYYLKIEKKQKFGLFASLKNLGP